MAGSAIVTGASSGIGAAYARRLAADGWDLVLTARRSERLDALADELGTAHGVRVRPVTADLGDADDVDVLCAVVEERAPDMLVNNAGLAHYMPFGELPAARARELVDVNALAPVLLSRAAVPGMLARGHGAIVNVASLLAFSAAADAPHLPQRAVYAATKSFLVTFSRILAAEVRPGGVDVQVVCPGVVRSEFHSRQGLDLSQVPRMEPDAVVAASLADLAAGVVVSIPGLAGPGPLEHLDAAGAELLGASRATELPDRYRRP
ncbi:MAG TPA: SDR family NAD(P)-dependent oxidoreductase [Acidimicrobiales bacterium]|nr:SDR family NAD(P)-dependent oxidoreductase [Acidimicrobiales bacterium]